MRYWMMRLFLTSRNEGLFALIAAKETREQYLRRVFASEVIFMHRKQKYVYRNYDFEINNLITGAIGRSHLVTLGDADFMRQEYPDWKAANLFIDPTGEDDGQKVAMHQVPVVGTPISVMRSFTDHLNTQNRQADWTITVNVISSKSEFWAAVEQNKGRIGELDLTFATPNIWGGTTETENALKKLQKENNADEVEVKLKNADKDLKVDSKDIRDSVEYIAKGGGSVVLREDGKTVLYNSEENVVTESPIGDTPIPEGDTEALRLLANKLFEPKK